MDLQPEGLSMTKFVCLTSSGHNIKSTMFYKALMMARKDDRLKKHSKELKSLTRNYD